MKTIPELTPQFYTVAELAKVLNCSRAAIYRAIEEGEMPGVKFGTTLRIPRMWVDQTIQAALLPFGIESVH